MERPGKPRLAEGHTACLFSHPATLSSCFICYPSDGDCEMLWFLAGLGKSLPDTAPAAPSLPWPTTGPSTIEISVQNLRQALNICFTMKGTMGPPGLIKTHKEHLAGWASFSAFGSFFFFFLFTPPPHFCFYSFCGRDKRGPGPPSSSTLPAPLFSQSDLPLLC